MSKIFATKDPAVSQREIDHRMLSRSLAGECIVLLENDGTLPLSRAGKLALYGSGARHTIRGGTGSGDVNVRSDVNIEQGLEKAGFTVTSKAWLDRQDVHHEKQRQDYMKWIPTYAKKTGTNEFLAAFSHPFQVVAPVEITDADLSDSDTDTAVYVISRTSGEGADRWNKRGDYLLYDEERTQLSQLGQHYSKLVVVLNVGAVIDLSELKQVHGINAVVLMGQLGNIGGDALADVLTGRVNPSGKLTDTWARRYEDYPSSAQFGRNDGNVDDEYYSEGIYVGYRYFDSFHVAPIYPFGYGKSYTSFQLGSFHVSVTHGTVQVTAEVKNTGCRFAGKEVVQLYCSAPPGELDKPYQELIAFEKTRLLSPGECQQLTLSFQVTDLASYDPRRAAWVLEQGEYLLRIGTSSRSTAPAAVLVMDRTVITTDVKNLFAPDDVINELVPPVFSHPAPDHVPRICLLGDEITTERVLYQGVRQPLPPSQKPFLTVQDLRDGSCTVEELVAQLTPEELANLCVGTLRMEGGSVVGNASHTVPGAAADTSSILWETRGIRNLILADGPAGLRLQPVFKADKQGHILPGGNVMGDFTLPFDPKYTQENSDTYYQYCTAIPVGWSLAQSWNTKLLEEIGSMVGREMELFGVDLWLAPALNIHRNPLCGRNFEYYSEDPLISGAAAAAITKGVQIIPGKGTTIKHFAANSQEENRYFTNSHISERALREIYLRGFEIAVRTAQPASIMTSYNLLNGIHTANSHDLIQAAARDEWGFEGVVMTDWFTSQEMPMLTGDGQRPYPISASTGCIFAGNDLQMPGCRKNVEDLLQAVKTGQALDGFSVTLADLQFCAANVIRAVLRAGDGFSPQ